MTLTLQQAVEGLKALAAERPDYVYETPDGYSPGRCVYANPEATEPSCIVGHLLHRNGVPLALLNELDDGDTPAEDISDHPDIPMELEARWLLVAVQGRQDRGVPWGKAVAESLQELGL